jgi:regulator of replication initiation timing
MKLGPIEDRLRASLNFDAINGDQFERSVVTRQVNEAIEELDRLRAENERLRKEVVNYEKRDEVWRNKYGAIQEELAVVWKEKKEARNLLAIIHKDGGHYEAEYGFIKALKDAEQLIIDALINRHDENCDSLDPETYKPCNCYIKYKTENSELKKQLFEAEARLEPIRVVYKKYYRLDGNYGETESMTEFVRGLYDVTMDCWRAIQQAVGGK